MIDRAFLKRIALTGMLTAGVALSVFAYELHADSSVAQARNAAFSVLVIAELLRSFGARSNEQTIWQMGLFSNIRMFVVVAASFVLQLLIHHLPMLETLFDTEPVSAAQCAAWIALGAISLIVLELGKVYRQSVAFRLHTRMGHPVS